MEVEHTIRRVWLCYAQCF